MAPGKPVIKKRRKFAIFPQLIRKLTAPNVPTNKTWWTMSSSLKLVYARKWYTCSAKARCDGYHDSISRTILHIGFFKHDILSLKAKIVISQLTAECNPNHLALLFS